MTKRPRLGEGANIGCDFHPGFQQVAIFDNTSGEIQEGRLGPRAEAEQFYRSLAGSKCSWAWRLAGFYRRLAARKHRALAKVAVARKLATRLYLILREDWTYAQLCRAMVSVSPSHSVVER